MTNSLLRQAIAHHQEGKLDQAARLYRQLVETEPRHADGHNLLGVIARQQGRLDDALELIAKAIAIRPVAANYHFNLADTYREKARFEEAIASYRTALSLSPRDAEMHHGLGLALDGLGRREDAADAFGKAVQLAPGLIPAWYDLGRCLMRQGRLDEAIPALERVQRGRPNDADVLVMLGRIQIERGRPADGVDPLRRAVSLRPDSAEGHSNLGVALARSGRLAEGAAAARKAAELAPGSSAASANLATILHHQRRLDDAIACARKNIEVSTDSTGLHSGLLFTLNYHPASTAADLYAEAQRWWRRHGEPLAADIKPHTNTLDPERRLRIGYVSPSFCGHVVAMFMEPILSSHDHQQFEVFCYSDVARPDRITDRLRSHADAWRNLYGKTDDAVAELIRKDGIDILVDLAGHTSNNRLKVFARKPAPVQVSYLEYPPTTGLKTIDYKITDAYVDPPGVEHHYAEQLLRLPGCAWCYQPQGKELQPSAPPAMQLGHVTFGCLNNPAKLTNEMLGVWAGILRAVDGAKLLLLHNGDASDRQMVLDCFAARGVGPERVQLLTRQPHRLYLEAYQRIDIALDPFPYNGHTTTCDALWLGVPVVTLAGVRHVSRVGGSLLTALGHSELIARTFEEYHQTAVRLAGDRPALQGLRAQLAEEMRRSPLTDGAALTSRLEEAYRDIWRRHCERPAHNG